MASVYSRQTSFLIRELLGDLILLNIKVLIFNYKNVSIFSAQKAEHFLVLERTDENPLELRLLGNKITEVSLLIEERFEFDILLQSINLIWKLKNWEFDVPDNFIILDSSVRLKIPDDQLSSLLIILPKTIPIDLLVVNHQIVVIIRETHKLSCDPKNGLFSNNRLVLWRKKNLSYLLIILSNLILIIINSIDTYESTVFFFGSIFLFENLLDVIVRHSH